MTDEEVINEQIKNGGSAFPSKKKLAEGATLTQYGMSLRDYFAAKALVAFMSSDVWLKGMDREASKNGIEFKPFIATHCYRMADAMLAERIKESE